MVLVLVFVVPVLDAQTERFAARVAQRGGDVRGDERNRSRDRRLDPNRPSQPRHRRLQRLPPDPRGARRRDVRARKRTVFKNVRIHPRGERAEDHRGRERVERGVRDLRPRQRPRTPIAPLLRLVNRPAPERSSAHRRQTAALALAEKTKTNRRFPDAHHATRHPGEPFLETLGVAREEPSNVGRDAEAAQHASLEDPRDEIHALFRGFRSRARTQQREAIHQDDSRSDRWVLRRGRARGDLQQTHRRHLRVVSRPPPGPPLAVHAHDGTRLETAISR